jgi:hypothetical protein
MNPPVHPTSLGLVGNWQLLVAFLLRLACRPLRPYAGRHPRARTPLSRSPTITRFRAPLPVEPRPDFLPTSPRAPALRHHLGQHSMSLRCLGSRSWRNGLGLWFGNGLGSGMRELRARLCYLLVLVCLWFCRLLSRSIAFVCFSLACLCLSLLVFAFAVVRLLSDERPSVFRVWRRFLPTSLYKRRLCT